MLDRLTANGHKLTTPRRRVLAVLREAHEPLPAQDIAARACTSVASTYRVLALLVELGMVSEVEEATAANNGAEGRLRRYALCTHTGHHHHFVCRSCHATLEVESEALEHALADLASSAGLLVERHDVTLLGQCTRCLASQEGGRA